MLVCRIWWEAFDEAILTSMMARGEIPRGEIPGDGEG